MQQASDNLLQLFYQSHVLATSRVLATNAAMAAIEE